MCYATHPIFAASSDTENEVCIGDYSVSIANAIRFIKDQGTFTADKFDDLDQETQKNVARSTACFVLNMIDGIGKICGERDERNLATTFQLPHVLPNQWLKLGTSDLVEILRLQRNRLLVTQDREFVRRVEEDHKALKRAVLNEKPLMEILEKHGTDTNLYKDGSW